MKFTNALAAVAVGASLCATPLSGLAQVTDRHRQLILEHPATLAVELAGGRVVIEDLEVCSRRTLLGFFVGDTQTIYVCVENHQGRISIVETTEHEVIHFAQFCRGAVPFLTEDEIRDLATQSELDVLKIYDSSRHLLELEARVLARLLAPEQVAVLVAKACKGRGDL